MRLGRLGRWRFTQKDEEGNEYAFRGVTHEMIVPEWIIGTFEFEGLPEPGHVLLETTRFEALPGGRTRITAHSIFSRLRTGMA